MMNKTLRRILLIVCIAVALYSAVRLVLYFSEMVQVRNQNAENARLVNEAMTTAAHETEENQESSAQTSAAQNPAEMSEIPEITDDSGEEISEISQEVMAVNTEEPAVATMTERTMIPDSDTMEESASAPRSLMSLQSGNANQSILPQYRKLHLDNPDMVGWLKIPLLESRINLAVVHRDNVFYLNHDFSGKKNSNGTLFLDENCSMNPPSDNLLVYGHNMKTGDMFGELHRLESASFLAKDPFVTFNTLYEEATWIPICIGIVSLSPSEEPYFNFTRTSFSDSYDFDYFISQAREASSVRLNTDTRFGDQLLTLVTCCDGSDNRRFIVMLRKMRDGETKEDAKKSMFSLT